jgi:4-hydroxybutyrate dehydrogenase
MNLLCIKPNIYKYKSFVDFIAEFNLCKDDLLIVSTIPYDTYIKPLNLDVNFIFPEQYSSSEPNSHTLKEIIKAVEATNYKRVIGIGGGTILDVAKILALNSPKEFSRLYGDTDINISKNKQLILIPTTCGSGSEMTMISAIRSLEHAEKNIIYSHNIYADYAVLIPEFLKTLPYKNFISSSLDAFIHAAESFMSPASNYYTEFFSQQAIEVILSGYLKLIEKGQSHYSNLMEDYLIASNCSGIAFDNTGLGIIQALSYPYAIKYNVNHGDANYQFFTEVFKRYSQKKPQGKIKYLNNIISEILMVRNNESLYDELQSLLDEFYPKKSGKEVGMQKADFEIFTSNVIKNHSSLIKNSYIEFVQADIKNIYTSIY